MICKRNHSTLFVILLLFLFGGCNFNPLNIDASSTKVDIRFYNLDSLIAQTEEEELPAIYFRLKKEIPNTFDYHIGYCMQIGNVNDTAFVNSVMTYRKDSFIQQLENTLKNEFASLEKEKKKLQDGFKHIKYHLPKTKLPKAIVFSNSLFNSNAFATEEEIVIGMERYLGPNSKMVKRLPSEPFYTWVKEAMLRKFLERDAVTAWNMTHIVPEVDGMLAEKIIRWGKILYLTEAAFPKESKATILRYSSEDYDWAIENEFALWKYLVDQKMLLEVNEQNERNFLHEGPFTPGLPEKGPDRLGRFLGWRMVHKFMDESGTSVQELVQTSYNEILQTYDD